jgi:hypothetical protein
MLCRSPGRDDANALIPLCVRNGHHLTADHAEKDTPLLAMGFAHVDPLDGKRVAKRESRLLEAHAVIAQVLRSLGAVPLELHSSKGYPQPVQKSRARAISDALEGAFTRHRAKIRAV